RSSAGHAVGLEPICDAGRGDRPGESVPGDLGSGRPSVGHGADAGRITRVNPSDGSTAAAITIAGILTDGPSGLLGMARDPGLLKGTGRDFVYLAYTYNADSNPATLARRTRIVRLAYDSTAHTLGCQTYILPDLPAGTAHQGGRLIIGPDRKLYFTMYESEHGPNTDDEVNLIRAGGNYGWPHVAGYRDDQSYAYANWSASRGVPCASL